MSSLHQVLNVAFLSLRNNGTSRLMSEETLGCNTSYHLYERWFSTCFMWMMRSSTVYADCFDAEKPHQETTVPAASAPS